PRGPRYGSARVSAVTRAALTLISVEGALATVFTVLTGGAFLTGLALLWGANDFEIGLLTAAPFLAPIAQLASAYLIDRTGARKRITVRYSVIARQSWWLIVPVALLPIGFKLEILIAVVIVCAVAINIATVGWMSWVADLVPERIRGRFFGTRNVAISLATLLATMIGGIIVDYFRHRGREPVGFAVIIAAAAAFAAAAAVLLNRTPDRPSRGARIGWDRLVEPLRNPTFRHLLVVFSAWNCAIGIAAPFFAPHMLTNLGMSFTLVAAYSSAAAVIGMFMNRPWGALIDRFGCKPVIAFTALGIGFIPLVWLFPTAGHLGILIPEVIFSAILWTGFNLAAFNIPIANSPSGRRNAYLALFSMVTGIAFFAASLLGGYLAERWSGMTWQIGGRTFVNYHLLFAISAVLRFGSGLYALTFHEPAEKRLPVMIQFMGYSVLRAVWTGRHLFPKPPRLRPKRPADPTNSKLSR
ncbi:MAG TPA: MFS transporter, partial [candidate division Zixibacteria bacterium]|nr:MFS transporter [candidate division Zixibacteria bacterium]